MERYEFNRGMGIFIRRQIESSVLQILPHKILSSMHLHLMCVRIHFSQKPKEIAYIELSLPK